ncbi:hypothetical protein HDU67_010393 [Dinochytrium kinnereticum]|nr:hypothetical protein HDU67_010393 [Dinochytrium kinnereticum]
MTVRSLRKEFGVRDFVYGGFHSGEGESDVKAFQATTFEGGSVLEFETILKSVQEIQNLTSHHDEAEGLLNATDPSPQRLSPPPTLTLPQPFPLPVAGQMLHWESYSTHGGNVTTPDEFVRRAADAHLFVEDPTDVVAVWRAASEMLWRPSNGVEAGTRSLVMQLRDAAALGVGGLEEGVGGRLVGGRGGEERGGGGEFLVFKHRQTKHPEPFGLVC